MSDPAADHFVANVPDFNDVDHLPPHGFPGDCATVAGRLYVRTYVGWYPFDQGSEVVFDIGKPYNV